MSKLRVFIEYIHPSVRELAGGKGLWDVVSYLNRWRHARLIITKEPVPFISGDVKGDVYDAGNGDKSRLVPMCEKFQATSCNRYLPIGNLEGNVGDGEIKALLNEFLKQNPDYDLMTNNCEDLAKALGKKITRGSFPTLEKMRAAVYPVTLRSLIEDLIKIKVKTDFEDAIICNVNESLTTKGSGSKNIDDISKKKK